MMPKKTWVYPLIATFWITILSWQWLEHSRVRESARATLVTRARDLTSSLGLLIRSQRRFGNIVSQERLEPALRELVKSEELLSVSLLNISNEVVASAHDKNFLAPRIDTSVSERWSADTITLVNLVDLGTTNVAEGSGPSTIIVMPRRDPTNSTGFEPPESGRPAWRSGSRGTNALSSSATNVSPPESAFENRRPSASTNGSTNVTTRGPRDRSRPPGFGRPPWMSEAEYASLLQRQGLHSFVVVLSTQAFNEAIEQDVLLRSLIGLLATVAAGGLGLAWRNQLKSSDLELRLVRASEQNHHLRELNVAAAGLAHETRNPLNIIRGLAQLISRQSDATPEVRSKSKQITDEVDRVTAQLNEFINYSRPREVHRKPVNLNTLFHEVSRALECDLQEKPASLQIHEVDFAVQADEILLRQTLFNLLLNAIQAVPALGLIEVRASTTSEHHAWIEVKDNGPGVPPANQPEIFKPYFTTNPNGTGLGLAVVQQIVLAHGWDIHYSDNGPHGAVFRISRIEVSPLASATTD